MLSHKKPTYNFVFTMFVRLPLCILAIAILLVAFRGVAAATPLITFDFEDGSIPAAATTYGNVDIVTEVAKHGFCLPVPKAISAYEWHPGKDRVIAMPASNSPLRTSRLETPSHSGILSFPRPTTTSRDSPSPARDFSTG